MSILTASEVERALDQADAPVRDQIVLSAAEVANAYKTAIRTPRLAVNFLADCAEQGITVASRTRARYELAAQVVIDEGLFPVYDEPAQLSAADTAAAYEIGLNSPEYAEEFLAKRQAVGEPVVDAQLVAKFELAAEVARGHALAAADDDVEFAASEKPEPVVSHTTTVRQVPALATNAAGNRQIETDELLVQFVEVDDDGSDRDPVVVMDHEQEMAELPYARFVVAHVRFLAAIDPTGYLRGIAEREQAAAVTA